MATYFIINFIGEPTDADRERVAYLVRQGFTEGELINEADDEQ